MSPTPADRESIRRRVLVVDDDPAFRALCAELLRSEGFEVTEARDGREGTALAMADPPDLILCDVNMPILDGFGLAVTLRSNSSTANVPLVFVTSEADPDVERRAAAVGAVGLLSKPLLPVALTSFIRTVLWNAGRSRIGGHAF